MIRVGSGASGNYGPPPPAAAASSSTLSPLAPPFTVASMANLSPLPPPPPAHQLPSSQSFFGFPGNPSEWSPAAAGSSSASRLSSLTAVSHRSSPSNGIPYYARYPPSMPGSGLDPLEPPPEYEGYAGVGVGPWNGPFDGGEVGRGKALDGVSSWLDPSSSYRVPSLQKVEGVAMKGCGTYEDDSYGIWHGKYVNAAAGKVCFGSESSEWLSEQHSTVYDESTMYPYNFSGASVLASSALLEGTSYSHIPDSTSVMESCNTFLSNSSYDRYMAQLDSCSTNPAAYYQAPACSTSGQAFAPSALRISSTLDHKDRYSTVHHAVTNKLIDMGNVASKQKEPDINQYIRGKEGQDEKSRADYSVNKSTSVTAYEKGMPSDNNSSTETYMDFSTGGDSGLKIKHLKISDASNPAGRSAEPEDTMPSSSETLDEVNLAVDSPCWKGTPAFRLSPFRAGETVCLQPVNKELKELTDLDKGQNHLPDSVVYSGTPAEQLGNLIYDENRKKSSVSEVKGSSVISSNMQQKSENNCKTSSDGENDANRGDILCADNHKEQTNEVRKDQKIDSGAKDDGATQCNQKESIAANQFITADGYTNPEKGSTSLQLKNIQLLIREVHSSSKLLLSTNWSDDTELEEDDCRLLRLAIQNLEALVLRNKKGSVEGDSHVSGLEASCSQNTSLKTDVAFQSAMNNTWEMKGNMHWVGGNMEGGEFQHFISPRCDINLGKINGMMQDLGNALEKTFSEGNDNPQMLLYRNLWIEAEVEMCRLKYELQLARMRIGVDSHKCQTRGEPPQMNVSRSPSTVHDFNGCNTPLKDESFVRVASSLLGNEGKNSSRKPQKALSMLSSNEDKSEDLGVSAMTQTRALKQQISIWNSRNIEEQLKLFDSLDFGIFSGTKEAVRSPWSDNEDNSGLKHLSTKLADLGFTESSPSYLMDGPVNSGSVVKKQHFLINKNEEIGQASGMSGDAANRGFSSNSLGGKVIQPSVTNKQGKRFLTGGYDSPSSEWEHVLKEEFS